MILKEIDPKDKKELQELEKYIQGHNWIQVKQHRYNNTIFDSENYKNLENHHIEETSFLIEKVRELAKKLKIRILNDYLS